jgi:hypothetical protein
MTQGMAFFMRGSGNGDHFILPEAAGRRGGWVSLWLRLHTG